MEHSNKSNDKKMDKTNKYHSTSTLAPVLQQRTNINETNYSQK